MTALPRIEDFEDPSFNPFIAERVAFGDHPDPYPVLARLRREVPVHELDYRVLLGAVPDLTQPKVKHFAVLSYDAVTEVFANPATYSNEPYKFLLGGGIGPTIVTMDAPEHTRYRRIFQQAFLPGVVRKWSDDIVEPTIARLLDPMMERKEADLVADFTKQYPFHIIYQQLDLPPEDREVFYRLTVATNLGFSNPKEVAEAGEKLGKYFRALIAKRRAEPSDDLVGSLVAAEVEGERLPEELLVSFLRQLINAGGDTTYRATSILLHCLLQDPEQLRAVREDRGLVPLAIEEALRWDGPILNANRRATRDVTLGGVAIPAGSIVDTLSGAANRDETRFPDPDRFDLHRDRRHKHYGFAAGPHVCIGQHLARLEMTRALNAVLDRFPTIRLDPDRPEPEILGVMMRVPEHLYVRFD